MSGWQPIETAPKGRKPMIVLIARIGNYITDPYCCWWQEHENKWARWPHETEPTHWLSLPEFKS